MKISRKELKADARQLMIGKYGTAILVLMVADLLTSLLVSLVPTLNLFAASSISILINLVIMIILFFLRVLLNVGNEYFYLNAVRGRRYAVSDLFYAFRNQPDRIIRLTARLLIRALACTLPFLLAVIFFPIPLWGIETSLSPTLTYSVNIGAGLLTTVMLFAMYLNYMPVLYLSIDHPELSPKELMQTSRDRMRGRRWFYVKLELSFFGMTLLGTLSLGLGMLWVTPYRNMTNTLFYLNLNDRSTNQQ